MSRGFAGTEMQFFFHKMLKIWKASESQFWKIFLINVYIYIKKNINTLLFNMLQKISISNNCFKKN